MSLWSTGTILCLVNNICNILRKGDRKITYSSGLKKTEKTAFTCGSARCTNKSVSYT